MSLKEYKRKRKFDVTDEPRGEEVKRAGNSFVIQKHAATRLHYDFRLEHDGVLKSWAVPHGPSLDPSVKSLAVQVEDHPVEYASFEGTIPKGQYGGGTVMVWDRGTWIAEDEDIDKALARGKITFQLFGEKLRGAWSLVQMKSRGEENWLLLKRSDEYSVDRKKFDVVTEKPRSVLTGRDLSQIADGEKPLKRTKSNSSISRAPSPIKSKRAQAKVSDDADGKATSRSSKRATKDSSSRQSRSDGQTSARILEHLKKAPAGTLPKFIKPQLATLTNKMPTGQQWLHEIKLDGYRILARIDHSDKTDAVRLFTRSGLDWTERFAVIAEAVSKLPIDRTWLDGEIVALNGSGISDFQRLQNSLSEKDPSALVYYLFDLPWAEGKELTDLPLIERKQILSQLLEGQSTEQIVRYHEHIIGSGDKVLGKACSMSLEGLVAKRIDSPYTSRRNGSWLKIKCVHNQEFVIGGYTDPEGERTGFGALLLGYYEDRKLVYCGRVGTGFNETSLKQLMKQFKKLTIEKCPYDVAPSRQQQRGVHWLRPSLVAEISYATRTDDGLLRQSVFHGLREDKAAREVILEKPVSAPRAASNKNERVKISGKSAGPGKKARVTKEALDGSGGQSKVEGVEITHPDRIVFDELGITKLQLAQYLSAVSRWIMPEVAGRPLTLLRCPSGAHGKCFYQKHLDEQLPDGVRGVSIQEEKHQGIYPVIESVSGLIELAQRSVIEFHPWPAVAEDLDHPDRLVFDLDPGTDCPWEWVVQAAHDLRDALKQAGLTCFLRTSGGKGLHVVIPINPGSCSWDELKEFASLVAHSFAEQYPKRYVATITKAARRGKVFIDYLRNQRGATAIASYSPRARATAGVAMPISWRQLSNLIQGDQFTLENTVTKLRQRKRDPWASYSAASQDLPKL